MDIAMKLWNSVRSQAGKLAFEAERMVRIRKEESAIDEARKQITGVAASMGQVALSLYRSGGLDEPQIAALAKQVDELEASINQHEAAVVSIRAEVPPDSDGAPAGAPAYTVAPNRAESVAQGIGAPVPPVTPAPYEAEAPAADARKCPNCGASVAGAGKFCPECGGKLE